jgi:hypothetical protein
MSSARNSWPWRGRCRRCNAAARETKHWEREIQGFQKGLDKARRSLNQMTSSPKGNGRLHIEWSRGCQEAMVRTTVVVIAVLSLLDPFNWNAGA